MTDAHYHRDGYATFLSLGDREFRFYGFHPWQMLNEGNSKSSANTDAQERVPPGMPISHTPCMGGPRSCAAVKESLREALVADPHAGVGEIGLDRLKEKTISPAQRAAFVAQLEVAAEFGRPVVLHGAKCWGEVVAACRPYAGRIPAFLFHGFSRSGGLLPEIVALNGFVGVGSALLNDHAVNYRELVREVPIERVLGETDADYGRAGARPSLEEIVRKLAELRGMEPDALEAALDANAAWFVEALA